MVDVFAGFFHIAVVGFSLVKRAGCGDSGEDKEDRNFKWPQGCLGRDRNVTVRTFQNFTPVAAGLLCNHRSSSRAPSSNSSPLPSSVRLPLLPQFLQLLWKAKPPFMDSEFKLSKRRADGLGLFGTIFTPPRSPGQS